MTLENAKHFGGQANKEGLSGGGVRQAGRQTDRNPMPITPYLHNWFRYGGQRLVGTDTACEDTEVTVANIIF